MGGSTFGIWLFWGAYTAGRRLFGSIVGYGFCASDFLIFGLDEDYHDCGPSTGDVGSARLLDLLDP